MVLNALWTRVQDRVQMQGIRNNASVSCINSTQAASAAFIACAAIRGGDAQRVARFMKRSANQGSSKLTCCQLSGTGVGLAAACGTKAQSTIKVVTFTGRKSHSTSSQGNWQLGCGGYHKPRLRALVPCWIMTRPGTCTTSTIILSSAHNSLNSRTRWCNDGVLEAPHWHTW